MRQNGASHPKKEKRKRTVYKTGIGMYTIHKNVQADMYASFMKMAAMGYEGIEFYGEPVFDRSLLERSLKDSGLTLTGWHVEWANLQGDRFGETVRYLQAAGCPAAVVPCLGGKWEVAHGPKEECRQIWLRYIDEMNRISGKLAREGIRMGYHNHEHEFMLSYHGVKVFDILFEGLSGDIIMEFDTGNCIEGGDDPLRILKKYRDRDMFLHLKPYSREKGFDTILGNPEDANDWTAILEPDNKKYLWLLIESENTQLPEMKNAQLCLQGLKKYLTGDNAC